MFVRTRLSPQWLCQFACPPAMSETSCCFLRLPACDVSVLGFGHSDRYVVASHCCLICISLITFDAEHLFILLICHPYRLPNPGFLGFSCGSAGQESCNAGDLGLNPGLRRSLGEEKGYPLQYSGMEKSMNCIVHGVTKSQSMGSQRVHELYSPWGHKVSDSEQLSLMSPSVRCLFRFSCPIF